MADKPKLDFAEASACLKAYKPELSLGEWIGGGGFGDVYALNGTPVPMVVKIVDTRCVIPCDVVTALIKRKRRDVKKRLEEEINIMLLLQSCPSIMPLEDHRQIIPADSPGAFISDSSASVTLLFMPRLVPLSQRLQQSALSQEETVRLLKDISAALSACAQHGVSHHDVKPGNIYIRQDAGQLRFVLGDFGISQRDGANSVPNVQFKGYSPYRAPELLSSGEASGQNTDLYSLGVTAYECLTGTYPYSQNASVSNARIPAIGHISQELFDILSLMLQRDPNARYSHPSQLEQALQNISASSAPKASVKAFAPEVRRLLLNNDVDGAIRLARQGIRSREDSCFRLMALAVYKASAQSPGGYEQALRVISDLCLEGDTASIFLRGYLAGTQRHWSDHFRDMKIAAQEDFPPACYHYGRSLFYGDLAECPKDEARGMTLLVCAAEKNYYPALRLVQRLHRQHPEYSISAALRTRLEAQEYDMDPLKFREAMYAFL